MSLLVFGGTGQVGGELGRAAGGREVVFATRAEADFTDPASCAGLVEQRRPAAVINAAAYTAVDKAEEEEDLATLVNARTPGAIAAAAAAVGAPLVHISTDYVFEGSGTTPWSVDAFTAPLGAYGRSKLAGEEAVRAAGGPHGILRTSWVVSTHGKNFLKTMLRLGAERDRLTVVADQIGGPTCASDIAEACFSIADALIADPGKTGTYHFSGAPDVSWADFARAIFEEAGLDCAVEDIPSSAYPTPARRPSNSRLDNSLTAGVFGLARPDWRSGIRRIIAELGGQ